VRDTTTGRLKGTAFVEYADARSVAMAVAASEGKATAGGGVWVAAQRLVLAPALTQTDARSLASKLRGAKGGKDSRNLYLAKEGEIDPDSPAVRMVDPWRCPVVRSAHRRQVVGEGTTDALA
jgi:hypothetical protein